MEYIPGDLYVIPLKHKGIPYEVNVIVMEVEDGKITKFKSLDKEFWLLKSGFFEEGDDYVMWAYHFFLS